LQNILIKTLQLKKGDEVYFNFTEPIKIAILKSKLSIGKAFNCFYKLPYFDPFFFYCCAEDTLWRLQKFLQYIKYILLEYPPPSFSFIHPYPIPAIVSTDLIFPFTYMCTQNLYYIHPPFPTSLLLPLSPTSSPPQLWPILLTYKTQTTNSYNHEQKTSKACTSTEDDKERKKKLTLKQTLFVI
jgi:hypothetical protein